MSKISPLQAYFHYASIQRKYDKSKDYEGLQIAQNEQMYTNARYNFSPAKLETQRLLRIARSHSVFFLITTDIVGAVNAPYAIAQVGYVPGITLYVLLGAAALFRCWLLNYCYCKFDSNNYPVRTFSDLAARMVAPWFRYSFALLRFIQMLLAYGSLLLGTAQALSQMLVVNRRNNNIFFTVDILVWALLCVIVGQISSLGKFAHIANTTVWMNNAICIITVVGVAVGGPYYGIFQQYGKGPPYFQTGTFNSLSITKYAVTPGTVGSKIGGMSNMVFAWGGATIFWKVTGK